MKASILFFAIALMLILGCNKPEKLPYLQMEVVTKKMHGKTVEDTIIRTIPDFKLFNQDSMLVTSKIFDNSIYVADFFFTSCPTICPTMHRNLFKVYKKFEDNPEVKYASHTIDVKYDKPSRLKAYADKMGIKGNNWQFLWGTRDQIYGLSEQHYMVSTKEDDKAPGGFAHQGYFILVDKQKRIRGAYDGTLDEDVQKLMKDMEILLNEK
ncbi:MAG: SCO family protein [Chitinophagaceae bacterium]|nr:MAG: SCO family protein [Chitinophagaceae bacterium]